MTTVSVTHTAEPSEQPELPAPVVDTPKNPLASLGAIRRSLQQSLHIDLQVPRYGTPEVPGTPEIYVRYSPVDNVKYEEIVNRRSKDNAPGWTVWASAEILANHCLGVYAVNDGDVTRKYSLASPENASDAEQLAKPWTKFDPALRDTLGKSAAECPTASHVVRALYFTDGDMNNATTALLEWSGQSAEKLEEDFSRPSPDIL